MHYSISTVLPGKFSPCELFPVFLYAIRWSQNRFGRRRVADREIRPDDGITKVGKAASHRSIEFSELSFIFQSFFRLLEGGDNIFQIVFHR